MAGLFKGFKKAKSAPEVVSDTKTAVMQLMGVDQGEKHLLKIQVECTECLEHVREMLLGDGEAEPSPDQVSTLAHEIYNSGLLQNMVEHLALMNFDSRRLVHVIFSGLLKRQIGTRWPTVEYIATCPSILSALLDGYNSTVTALICGAMIRESVEYEPLCSIILHEGLVYEIVPHLESESFEIQSDAFLTFRAMIASHPVLCAAFLEESYDTVFEEHYENLLSSQNYITRRQSLKLLSELLLDRQNYNIMQRYIAEPAHLKCVMKLLLSKSRNIQFEAFHVFKVFVANPNKPPAILSILTRNKKRLTEYLSDFHNDRDQDDQFMEERAFLVREISALPTPKASEPAEAAAAPAAAAADEGDGGEA